MLNVRWFVWCKSLPSQILSLMFGIGQTLIHQTAFSQFIVHLCVLGPYYLFKIKSNNSVGNSLINQILKYAIKAFISEIVLLILSIIMKIIWCPTVYLKKRKLRITYQNE